MRPRRTAGVALALASFALGGCGNDRTAERGGQVGRVLFARDLGGAVVPGPVPAADGSILAASNAGVLHAIDPRSGRDRWRFDGGGPYGVDLSTSPLQLPDGTILWPGPRERLFALDPAGRLLWSVDLGAMGTTPARGAGDAVYVQDVGGRLHAFAASRRGGRERWSQLVGDGVSYASVSVGRRGVVYTTVGSELVAVRDRGDRAAIAWRFRAGADVEVSPVVAADGTIVLGTNDAFQYGVAPDGRERWRWRREVFTYSSPVATADGKVRFGDHRGRLVTLDGATGRLLRIDRGRGQVWGAPAVSPGGTVVFSGHPGEVFGVDRAGRRVLRVRTGGLVESTPAFGADGTVYIGSRDGKVYALRRSR